MKVADLLNVIDGNFESVHKSIGHILVENGFMNYTKLTVENYNYWWYAVADGKPINKKVYTYDWNDLVPTRKFEKVKEFIKFHDSKESGYKLLTNVLNLIDAEQDGFNKTTGRSCYEEVLEKLYTREKQASLF